MRHRHVRSPSAAMGVMLGIALLVPSGCGAGRRGGGPAARVGVAPRRLQLADAVPLEGLRSALDEVNMAYLVRPPVTPRAIYFGTIKSFGADATEGGGAGRGAQSAVIAVRSFKRWAVLPILPAGPASSAKEFAGARTGLNRKAAAGALPRLGRTRLGALAADDPDDSPTARSKTDPPAGDPASPAINNPAWSYVASGPGPGDVWGVIESADDEPGPDLALVHSEDSGASWQVTPVRKPQAAAEFHAFCVGADGNGRLTLYLDAARGPRSAVGYYHYLTRDAGHSWSAPRLEADAMSPAVEVSDDDQPKSDQSVAVNVIHRAGAAARRKGPEKE